MIPVWAMEKHQGGLTDKRKQIVQLQTTACCKEPLDGAGYKSPGMGPFTPPARRAEALCPPPPPRPGGGAVARPRYGMRGRGNEFVQL